MTTGATRPAASNAAGSVAARVKLSEARRSLAIHYGTFDLSDEPQDEPPRRFREAMAANGSADESIWIVGIGESRVF